MASRRSYPPPLALRARMTAGSASPARTAARDLGSGEARGYAADPMTRLPRAWQIGRWEGAGVADARGGMGRGSAQRRSGRSTIATHASTRGRGAAYRVRVCGFFWILFSFGFLFLRAGMPLTRINGDFHIPFGACGLALPHAKTPFGPHGKNLFCSSEPRGLGFN